MIVRYRPVKILGLARRMLLQSGDLRLKNVMTSKFVGSCHYTAAFCLQVTQLCTDLDLIFLYILIKPAKMAER